MQNIKRTLAALMALAVFLSTPGLALAADATPGKNPFTADVVIVKPHSWTGPYIGIGAGWEATGIEDGVGLEFTDDSGLGYARLGYRYQLPDGRLVFGVFAEGNVAALDIEHEIEATYAAMFGGEIGLALGGLLVTVEGGFGKTFIDGNSAEDPSGPFVGLRSAVDLGGGLEFNVLGRARIEEEGKIDFNKIGVMVGGGYRF